MNTNTAEMIIDDSYLQDIAARRKLATITLGAWRARRLNRPETLEVNQRHNTKDAAKVSVLQCDLKALTEINKLQAAARVRHEDLTLPSIQKGMRFMISGMEFEHAEEMGKFSQKQDVLVAELIAEGAYQGGANYYAQQGKLNGLFDKRAWPSSASALRSEFSFSTRYLSCPTDGAWADWLAESCRAADAALHDRIEEALKRVAERCGNNGRLYNTVFSNLGDLVKLVPGFDLTGRYKAIMEEAADLAKYSAEELRDDETGRKTVGARADKLVGLLGNL